MHRGDLQLGRAKLHGSQLRRIKWLTVQRHRICRRLARVFRENREFSGAKTRFKSAYGVRDVPYNILYYIILLVGMRVKIQTV